MEFFMTEDDQKELMYWQNKVFHRCTFKADGGKCSSKNFPVQGNSFCSYVNCPQRFGL